MPMDDIRFVQAASTLYYIRLKSGDRGPGLGQYLSRHIPPAGPLALPLGVRSRSVPYILDGMKAYGQLGVAPTSVELGALGVGPPDKKATSQNTPW
jgi:hypothetical protein